MSDADLKHMSRAFELARAQNGRTGTNPSVGCVIVGIDGGVLSEGATADGGRPHAEELALKALGGKAVGAAIYVTLEPCRERSSDDTACSSLLIDAGVARVICAIADTHPKGAGGFERLREAGLSIEIGLMADEASALYAEFFKASS